MFEELKEYGDYGEVASFVNYFLFRDVLNIVDLKNKEIEFMPYYYYAIGFILSLSNSDHISEIDDDFSGACIPILMKAFVENKLPELKDLSIREIYDYYCENYNGFDDKSDLALDCVEQLKKQ